MNKWDKKYCSWGRSINNRDFLIELFPSQQIHPDMDRKNYVKLYGVKFKFPPFLPHTQGRGILLIKSSNGFIESAIKSISMLFYTSKLLDVQCKKKPLSDIGDESSSANQITSARN